MSDEKQFQITQANLYARLAENEEERKCAYQLRHRLFFRSNQPTNSCPGIETDAYDQFADQLLLFTAKNKLIGTCRLIPQQKAINGFYSQQEFDVNSIIDKNKELKFLEIGRACIDPDYRSGSAVKLLWQAIWTYFRETHHDTMIGCASLEGTDLNLHAETLAFLKANFAAPQQWDAKPVRNPIEIGDKFQNPKMIVRSLPPLLKGYLRLGAYISTAASIDYEFGTTDLLVVLPKARINPKYLEYFGQPNH